MKNTPETNKINNNNFIINNLSNFTEPNIKLKNLEKEILVKKRLRLKMKIFIII